MSVFARRRIVRYVGAGRNFDPERSGHPAWPAVDHGGHFAQIDLNWVVLR